MVIVDPTILPTRITPRPTAALSIAVATSLSVFGAIASGRLAPSAAPHYPRQAASIEPLGVEFGLTRDARIMLVIHAMASSF